VPRRARESWFHSCESTLRADSPSLRPTPQGVLDDPSWTTKYADEVAAAVLDWAKSHNASVYCHWFQPLGASGCRHGLSGQVQNSMFEFKSDGTPSWDFKGKDLLKGETDGSSYPNGGLRATHTAGGYLAIDPSSPIFLRGDTIFIPSALVSYVERTLLTTTTTTTLVSLTHSPRLSC